MEAFDGRLLDGAVHPLDLTVGPRVVRFGEPVLDPVCLADHVEAHLTRPGRVAVTRLLGDLKKALSERMLSAELDDHLENEGAAGAINRRNGSSRETMLTGTSKVTLDVPRDRAGTFDPKLITKYQRRFPDFDDKIISMYACGMTVREIRGHLEELYGIDVSPDLISTVTDAVLETVAEWQGRPLDTCYPLMFFDAIRVKIRDEGFVRNKAVYIALGIQPDGTKEVLGIWIEQTEGAKF